MTAGCVDAPTSAEVLENGPLEYKIILLIAGVALFISTTLFVFVTNRAKLSGCAFVLNSLYPAFISCNFIGMIILRGAQFLHFIACTYEAVCCYAFFRLVLGYLESSGFTWSGEQQLGLRAPPICLPCMPSLPNTERTRKILSRFAIQVVYFQGLVEFSRVLQFMDCTFEEHSWKVYFTDGLVISSFMCAIWSIMVLVRAEIGILRQHHIVGKFLVFKLLIGVSKFLERILNLVIVKLIARDGLLKPKEKALVWGNFGTIVAALLLQALAAYLYTRSSAAVRPRLYPKEESSEKLILEDEDDQELGEPC